MSYVLPIPQYQYNDYRERVLNQTSSGYTYAAPAEKVTFDKVLQDRAEPDMSLEEQRKKRQQDHEVFRLQMAKVSGKGFEIDQRV